PALDRRPPGAGGAAPAGDAAPADGRRRPAVRAAGGVGIPDVRPVVGGAGQRAAGDGPRLLGGGRGERAAAGRLLAARPPLARGAAPAGGLGLVAPRADRRPPLRRLDAGAVDRRLPGRLRGAALRRGAGDRRLRILPLNPGRDSVAARR